MQLTEKSEIFANVADIVQNASWHINVEEPAESHDMGSFCIIIPESHDADNLHTVSPLWQWKLLFWGYLRYACLLTSFLFWNTVISSHPIFLAYFYREDEMSPLSTLKFFIILGINTALILVCFYISCLPIITFYHSPLDFPMGQVDFRLTVSAQQNFHVNTQMLFTTFYSWLGSAFIWSLTSLYFGNNSLKEQPKSLSSLCFSFILLHWIIFLLHNVFFQP